MFQRIKKTYKTIHHHIAHRPHRYLMARGGWYSRWHSWSRGRFYHKHVHMLALAAWIIGGIALISLFYHPTSQQTAA
jgi:predicted dehydrogenase